MTYREPEAEDPQVLVGVELPGSEDTVVDMAYAFAEELASMGHPAEAILSIFENPEYGAPHRALLALGADRIRVIVSECAGLYAKVRFTVVDGPAPDDLVQIGSAFRGIE
jgi:hypothetical protein